MNEQQLQLVSFEQAKRLKEAGFDWRVILLDNEYSFPTVALALKWFRDVNKIKSNVLSFDKDDTSKRHFDYDYSYRIVTHHTSIYDNSCYKYSVTNYHTYEHAESALLDELLTLIEKDK